MILPFSTSWTAEYDVVLAGDVLEHLVRPHDVLCRAVRLLRPGGHVVISLPHVGHVDVRLALLQGEWKYRPWGLLDATHVRFFTLPTIKEMLADVRPDDDRTAARADTGVRE